MMNRMFIRRCSMSSIEEEDESVASDELITQIEKLPSPPQQQQQQQALPSYHSPSVLEWDSELSESEQEFDDNDDNSIDKSAEQAANRALQIFMQSCSQTRQTSINDKNNCYSPFSIHLYDEEDSTELDAIITELQDFKVEFEENSNISLSQQELVIPKSIKINKYSMNSYPKSSSSLFSTNGCVSELRTLEDQLEAALASLTLTINDCSKTNNDSQQQQQRSSDSSACSSGLGDDIVDSSNTNHHTNLLRSKINTTIDDCDSAFSESGSTEKMTLLNPDESIIYRSLINPIKETSLINLDNDDSFLSHSQHRPPSKILVRTYNDDGSTKSIFIDDSMLIRDVLFLLIHKNHRESDINYSLIEILPDLHMERIFEDHQKLTEAILMWPTISSNRLNFTKRFEKYTFFETINSKDDDFLNTPDIEGNIYLKEKSRKSWKKYFCVLRSSGVYLLPKGKSKKDLICLAKFENVELFFGFDWKKKFKSPSDYCFALKHPLIQKKSSKYIKYMCVDTKTEFDRWIRSIRIAKFGQQLKINYFMMNKAMNIYRSTGHFISYPEIYTEQQQQKNDLPIHDRRTPIPPSQYYPINLSNNNNNDDDDGNNDSPIKSASYMDELRQRLERVVNDSSEIKESINRPTLIQPPKFKSIDSKENLPQKIKSPITIGSTPLPRKQIPTFGNLSYRTMNPVNNSSQQQMSKSFIISSKQEDQQNTSVSSTISKSDSTFLNNSNQSKSIINNSKQIPLTLKKPTISFRTNPQSQSSLSTKTDLISPNLKLSIPISKQNKPINSSISTNYRPVPPVPPRKSSVSRPLPIKPQPPQRNSSTNILLRKPYISHL